MRKTYSGKLMEIGKRNEDIVMLWLQTMAREVIDFREFRLAQRLDVDFAIETIDGNIVLAEIKSDKWISDTGNLCFEQNRINHYVVDKWFYLGWGWRSPAQKLIVRNPNTFHTYVFRFDELRKFVGSYVGDVGKKLRMAIVETDKQKTTFNILIPILALEGLYKKYEVK